MLPCHPCDYIFTVIYGLTQSKDCWRCTNILSSGQICLSHWGGICESLVLIGYLSHCYLIGYLSHWYLIGYLSHWYLIGYLSHWYLIGLFVVTLALILRHREDCSVGAQCMVKSGDGQSGTTCRFWRFFSG